MPGDARIGRQVVVIDDEAVGRDHGLAIAAVAGRGVGQTRRKLTVARRSLCGTGSPVAAGAMCRGTGLGLGGASRKPRDSGRRVRGPFRKCSSGPSLRREVRPSRLHRRAVGDTHFFAVGLRDAEELLVGRARSSRDREFLRQSDDGASPRRTCGPAPICARTAQRGASRTKNAGATGRILPPSNGTRSTVERVAIIKEGVSHVLCSPPQEARVVRDVGPGRKFIHGGPPPRRP